MLRIEQGKPVLVKINVFAHVHRSTLELMSLRSICGVALEMIGSVVDDQ
jgi:hypothetical protein